MNTPPNHPFPAPGKRPSLSDVAAAAGVGKSTAARALSHGRKVARKTQRLVLEAAQKLGYQPDLVLSERARQHWKSRPDYSGVPVAYLLHQPQPPHPLETQELQQAFYQAGLHFNLINTYSLPDAGSLTRVLAARGIQGALIGACLCHYEQFDIDWSHYSVVACDNSHFEPPFDWVLPDYAWCTREACRRAAARGYRQPGLAILRNVRTADHWQIESSFYQASYEWFGGQHTETYQGAFDDAVGFKHWLTHCRPDFVLCNNPTPWWWIKECSAPAPGFAALDSGPEVAVTGFKSVLRLCVERALQILDSHLRRGVCGKQAHPALTLVRPPWHEGVSLPDLSMPRTPLHAAR
jgi:DNA-binding LacI/PurR family transcriptional regulator